MKKMQKVLMSLLGVLALCATSYAAPVKWDVNGHSYDFINTNISWSDAKAQAESSGGYLATITSAEENEFIRSSFYTGQGSNFAWIGGDEPNDDGNWQWATGPEAGIQFSTLKIPTPPFNYANWGGIEPNDFKDNEDFAMFNIGLTFERINPGQWGDAEPRPNTFNPVIGYLVEYNPRKVSKIGYFILFALLSVYLLIRFIIWAIRTRKEKRNG